MSLICCLPIGFKCVCVCLCVSDICTENTTVQAEIVDKHNAFRRAVQPTASDMLKMVSPAFYLHNKGGTDNIC